VNLVELGAFLKSRRDRIRPADVGLPAGPRRRVSGLRRDEVAQLAGASVDYYIELERGAGAQPSEQMLAALARALRLSRDERDHVFYLAGRPVPAHGGPADHVHPGTLDLLLRLDGTPAQVVTDLRAAMARRGGKDSEVTALIADLTARSPEFTEHWTRHDVAFRRSDRKRLVHPDLGPLEVNCLNLFSEDGKQRLLWFTPAVGTDSVAKLEMLAVLGTQTLR